MDKKKILVVEDSNHRLTQFKDAFGDQLLYLAKNHQDAVKLIEDKNHTFDFIFLDHDLNESHYGGNYSDKKTGLDLIPYIVKASEEGRTPEKVVVHSLNEVRADLMCVDLGTARINNSYAPFPRALYALGF